MHSSRNSGTHMDVPNIPFLNDSEFTHDLRPFNFTGTTCGFQRSGDANKDDCDCLYFPIFASSHVPPSPPVEETTQNSENRDVKSKTESVKGEDVDGNYPVQLAESECGSTTIKRRRRGLAYSQSQQEEAIRLLNQGVPCRKVAESIDPRMSSGTPIRWRKKLRAKVEAQHRLNESFVNNEN